MVRSRGAGGQVLRGEVVLLSRWGCGQRHGQGKAWSRWDRGWRPVLGWQGPAPPCAPRTLRHGEDPARSGTLLQRAVLCRGRGCGQGWGQVGTRAGAQVFTAAPGQAPAPALEGGWGQGSWVMRPEGSRAWWCWGQRLHLCACLALMLPAALLGKVAVGPGQQYPSCLWVTSPRHPMASAGTELPSQLAAPDLSRRQWR